MIKNKGMAFIMASIFASAGTAQASEVYIEQAGDTGTFNITQTN
jgi:hypothetical protein